MSLSGVDKPLIDSPSVSEVPLRTLEQKAAEQVLLTSGLMAKYLTRNASDKTNMSGPGSSRQV